MGDLKSYKPTIESHLADIALGDSESVSMGAQLDELQEYHALTELFQGRRLQKLRLKIDLRVLIQLLLIYLLSYVDRSNVGNAKLFGALTDMKLSGQQWNTSLTVLFVTYTLCALPSNIALKHFGQKIWLPTLVTLVGIVTVCSGLQHNYGGWIAFRLLLGASESGMYGGCTYTLTTWYSPDEIHTRLNFFYAGASLSGAFSGLLAYGIGHLDHTWGYRGWRFIYVIEGLLTFIVGLTGFWWIQPSPEKARWLDEEERRFLILRNRFAAGGETGVAEREPFSWEEVRKMFSSFHIYFLGLIDFTVSSSVYAISFILPTIIADMGYSATIAQAMTVPPYVFACLCTFAVGYFADRYKNRTLAVLIPLLFGAIGAAIMFASVRYKGLKGVTLLGCFILAGGLYPVVSSMTAWASLNLAGSTKRATGIGLITSMAILGGVVGSNIFVASEAPEYPAGFGTSLGMLVTTGILPCIMYSFILKRINAKRSAMSVIEIHEKYTAEELAQMGDTSPLYRYAT